jgi:hypothetical protein
MVTAQEITNKMVAGFFDKFLDKVFVFKQINPSLSADRSVKTVSIFLTGNRSSWAGCRFFCGSGPVIILTHRKTPGTRR